MTETSGRPIDIRRGIQSLETGFHIIKVIQSAGHPLPLKKLSEATGLSSSKLQYYLISLMRTQMLQQDSATGFYSLGPALLYMGMGYLEQFDLFSASKTHMIELVEAIGFSVFLGVWGTRGPTIVYRVDSPVSRAVFELRVGSVLPLLRSALGRNFLAHLPYNTVNHWVEEELKDTQSDTSLLKKSETPTNHEEVNILIQRIRTQGISRGRACILSDFTALSAPIFDHSNNISGALTVMGPINGLDDSYEGNVARQLKEATRQISIAGGWDPLANEVEKHNE
ncbi:IclR family transcriptional regulator [Halomonas sp. AOP42-C1-46]|uniref:IclR family transcriptional regulator n=1 Tax=Halomonas sp. AOP42-C1-46 TaxID=3457671 RepID=UPI0040332025